MQYMCRIKHMVKHCFALRCGLITADFAYIIEDYLIVTHFGGYAIDTYLQPC